MESRNVRRRKATRPRVRGGLVSRHKKELEQLHVLMGLPAYPENFRDRYPLSVLNALLGGTMSSRLFQKIREERGLAYSVYSAVNAFLDTGLMMIYAATNPARGREVVRLVLGELRDLRDHGPTDSELEVAKEHLKGSLMLSLESTASRMSNLARQEMYYGRQFTLAEVLEGIANVKPASVHRVAQQLFHDGHVTLAAVGRMDVSRLGREALRL
jgi:predicted Zn-dependent peptidase